MNGNFHSRASREVSITIDGQSVAAREGEPLASVFLRLDDIHTRLSLPSGQPRAPFCMMGACFECLVYVKGRGRTRSCQELVRAGMMVERQDSLARLG